MLWDAIINMFEFDRSALRGQMAVRKLIIFKHDTELGCAPAHKLFDLVTARRKDGVEYPRSIQDYKITVDESKIPNGVQAEQRD